QPLDRAGTMSIWRRAHPTATDLLNQLEKQEGIGALGILRQIVAWLRPAAAGSEQAAGQVESRINDLRAALETRPELRANLSECLRSWLTDANYFPAFASLGILPRQGFRSEL